MSDYIVPILTVAIAFYCGWRVRTAIMMYHLGEDPDRMINILNKIKEINAKDKDSTEVKANGDVKIEHHHGHVYLFESSTDRFLAQGETLVEAIKMMDKRFPGRFELKVSIPDSHSS